MSGSDFDTIVIGGGPGGYVCAIRLAQLGYKVACVEARETLGGTCLNVGCIPSKALLESSHHLHRAQHEFKSHGIEVGKVKANLTRMIERKQEVIDSNVQGIDFLFKKNGVTWLRGFGSIEKKGLVKVTSKNNETKLYKSTHIIIATGSEPIEIPPAKFDHKFICDSTDALDWLEAPENLVVIGGGVIGLELGSVWNRLGSSVTVIEAMDKILGPTDKSVSNALLKALKKEGITFHMKTTLKTTTLKESGVELLCESKGKDVTFTADKVLVAVGRRPYTSGLGLSELGVETDDRGRINIDHKFRTNIDGIYAIGDVVKGPMLAHKAEDEGVALAEIIAGQAGHINYDCIPGIVYTWPEVATLGKTEEQLKKMKIKYKKGQFNFKANGRAKAMGDDDGLVKILAHAESDEILGAHIVGPTASELIAELVVAMEFKASSEDVARTVHAHPTLSEALKEAALAVDDRAIHA